jgi:hypothetical protein
MNGYDLSRKWFDFCFENPEKIKPNHTALYFFCIEHCNRLGWKKKFGLPTTMAKEAIGIRSYNTYIHTLNDLIEFGFIEMVEKSKNQYSSNIIALSNFNKALDKALDKAFIKHATKQSESTQQSIDSIDKQETKNKKQKTYKQTLLSELKNSDFDKKEYLDITLAFWELFKRNLEEKGISTNKIEKANGKWIDHIRLLIENDKYTLDDLREIFRFLQVNEFWKTNILSTGKLREQFQKLLLNSRKNEGTGVTKEGCSPEELAEVIGKHFATD